MAYALGLDWIRRGNGWAYCRIENGECSFGKLLPGSEASDLVAHAEAIVVDTPIGLPDSAEKASTSRPCDRGARMWVGPHIQHSVFSVPRFAEYQHHKSGGEWRGGHARGLLPAILSGQLIVDCNPKTFESHPEVVFAALIGQPLPPFARKREMVGSLVRLGVLSRTLGHPAPLPIESSFNVDFIDATAMAVVARDWRSLRVIRNSQGDPEPLGEERRNQIALPATEKDARGKPACTLERVRELARMWSI